MDKEQTYFMINENCLFKISRNCKECKQIIKSNEDQAYLDRFRMNCYQDLANLLLKDLTGGKILDIIEDMNKKYRLKNAVKNAEK